MQYYITRKGGSMIFRLTCPDGTRNKKHLVAGQEVTPDCVLYLGERKLKNLGYL